jgi:hypothetical protein
MSLPAIAKQLESKGRHGDTRLVHVTESELKGLHALAEAHGKKITINPETGLPEAFSLKSLLPTLLGAGLAMTGIGAPVAALMVGGGYSVATGSLQKGLMAGLGAYGGAGLTGSLMGAGTAAGAAGANAGVNAAANAGTNVAANAGANTAALTPGNVSALNGVQGGANAALTGGANTAGQLTSQTNHLLYGTPTVSNAASTVSQAAANTQAPTFMQTAAGNFDKASAGVSKLYEGGWDATSNFLGANKMNLGLAAAPMVSDALSPKPPGPETPVDKGMIRPYSFDANQTGTYADSSRPIYDRTAPTYDTVAGLGDTSEKQHFNPVFTAKEPYAAARGGIVGLAPGGVVENEAAIKSVGMNTDFPMAHIDTPIYANPMMSRPDARNVVNPSGDVSVDEFTGEPRMASGGIAGMASGGPSYSYDPNTQQFTQLRAPSPYSPLTAASSGGGFGGMIAALIDKYNSRNLTPAQRGQKVSGGTDAPPAPETPRVTGGIIPAEPVAQAPQSIYDTPVNQRLGLTSFYPTMDYSLDKFGSQFQPPPPPPEESVEQKAAGGMAGGGYNLGGYSDGGRLLRGPGDGVSDSIPASIGGRQPARLADGEFVVPARIVSELGNGSTEAGARKLYAMMDRVQKQRKKSVGKGKVAVNSRADKHLPA